MKMWMIGLGLIAMAGCVLSGCHRPQGAMIPSPYGSSTYYSTEQQPKSVVLVDTRDDSEIFRIDVPVGKQLTLDFVEDRGDDPVMRPDLMRYEIWDIGTTFGRLRNAVSVPNKYSRRIDWYLGDSPQYQEYPEDYEYRVGDDADDSNEPRRLPQGGYDIYDH